MTAQRTLVALLAAVAAACSSQPPPSPPPSTTPASESPTPVPTPGESSSPGPTAPPVLIGDCADYIFMPCDRLNATASVAIVGSDFALAYTSDRTPAWKAGPPLSAPDPGLGGWTLNILHAYDVGASIIESGDGQRRHVDATPVTLDGQPALAVPSIDAGQIYVFDGTGHHLRTIDGTTGRTVVTFAWDASGIASVTEPGGRITRIIRDSAGTPVQLVTPRGYRTQLGVLNGWLAAVVDPAGGIAHLTTTGDGLLEVTRDAAGARHVFHYDALGRITSLSGPDGQTVNFSVSTTADGKTEVSASTGGGRGWTATISADGLQRSYDDRNGTSLTVAIDGANRDVAAGDGSRVHLALAADGRWGMAAPLITLQTTSPAGRTATTVESRIGAIVDNALTPQPHSRTMTVNGGGSWSLSYDPATRALTSTPVGGRASTTTFDDAGRPANVTGVGLPSVAYTYDEGGRLATATYGTGPDARVYRYSYDLQTGAVTITDPLGNARTMSVGPVGNAVQTSTASGSEVEISEADAAGRISAFGGGALGLTHLHYRLDGRLDTLTLPPAAAIGYSTYAYDPDGVFAGIGYADGSGVTIGYDGQGRPIAVKTDDGSVALSYDAKTGALTGYDAPDEDLARVFDGDSVTKESWSGVVGATVDRQFDGQARVVSDQVNGGSVAQYKYDAAGRLTQAGEMTITRDPNSGLIVAERIGTLERKWQYDSFGAAIGETVTAGGQPVYQLSITRDGMGRVTERHEVAGSTEHTSQFEYDDAGRLSAATYDGAKTTYSYDRSGNLIEEAGANKVDYTYDARGELLTQGDRSFAYDAAGRLATVTDPTGTTSYHYDGSGRLLSVTLANGSKVTYTIDGLGRTVARRVDGIVSRAFVYGDLFRPAAQLDATGSVQSRFVYDSQGLTPGYVVRGGKTELVMTDDVGTPLFLVDSATGAVDDSYSFDAWGRGGVPPADVPFGLAGGLVDPDTGLIHFGARDYDPRTTHWTAPDPLGIAGGDTNQYRYVRDDPANRIDPAGTCDVATVGVGVSGGMFGVGGSIQVGFGVFGNELGFYGTVSGGVSTPGVGGGVILGCEFQQQPGNPMDQYSGSGESGDINLGEAGAGWDESHNGDGSTSLSGGHVTIGPVGAGGSYQYTHTGTVCITCPVQYQEPPPAPPEDQDNPGPYKNCVGPASECMPSDTDPGNDPANPQNVCGGDPPCDPDDPNSPDNGDSAGGPGSLGGPGSTGDPHLHNAAGFWFDFMAVGEFTALKSDSGDMVVQARQVPYSTSKWVSVTAQIAISNNGDRLTFAFEQSSMTLRVDGKVLTLHARLDLPHGGFISPETRSYLVGWPDGSLVRVFRNVKGLDITTRLMPERVGTIHGLLGPYTGQSEQTLIEARDGTQINANDTKAKFSYDDLYRKFGDSWRITQGESLFDYAAGDSTATFDDRSFPDPNPPPVDPATTAAAQALCERTGVPAVALPACILDVSYTGDAGWAVTTADSTLPGAATIDQLVAGEVFAINVGDTVSQGHPGTGAGETSTAHEVDLYPFTISQPTKIYLTAGPGCTDTAISWSLLNGSGEVVRSDKGFTTSSICFDLDSYSLPAGTYTVRVVGGSIATTYSFTISAVAATGTFPITLDEVVAPGQPSAGAGELTTPGETDLYTFNLTEPTTVYLDALGDCAVTEISWELLGPDGQPVRAATGATSTAACFDFGIFALGAGDYTIRVTTTDKVGAYSFEVWKVPSTQTFPIKLDQVVGPGQPAAGAGELTIPGETDLYTLSLAQPTTVYLDAQGLCTYTEITWQLLDANGEPVTATTGATSTPVCFDFGTFVLSAGNYTISVTTSDKVGQYSFEVWTVPPTLTFPITFDQIVAAGQPATGAGELKIPGETDLYTFSVSQPTTVYLDALGACADTEISWQLVGPDGTPVAAADGATGTTVCFDFGPFALPAGNYTIRVTTSDAKGSYSFAIRTSPPPT